jgi:putative tricarboxylic transport membrane protein
MVLGPLLETNFRNALILSEGSFMIFITKPISVTLLCIAALLLISPGFSSYRRTKTRIIEEAGTGD